MSPQQSLSACFEAPSCLRDGSVMSAIDVTRWNQHILVPKPSMYCTYTIIYTYIWLMFMVNVGKYTIHGCYGVGCFFFRKVTSDTVMPGVRYDHSISFVQKRELPSAKITERTQELDTIVVARIRILYLLTINVEQFQDIMAVAISSLKEKSVGCWLSDCQGTVAAVSHSLIAMDKATCEQNIGDSGWEYRFLEWILFKVMFQFATMANHQTKHHLGKLYLFQAS